MPTALFHIHMSLQKKKKPRKYCNIRFTNGKKRGTKQLDAFLKDKQEAHGNITD